MEFLIAYLGTIIASLVIDKINYNITLNKIMKDDRYVIKQAYDLAYNRLYGLSFWEVLFPVYNVLKSGYQVYHAKTTDQAFYDVLEQMQAVELMEPEAIKEFKENPTPQKTRQLTKKHEKHLDSLSIIAFSDKSVMYFDRNEDGFKKIKRVIGPLYNEDIYTKYEKLEHALLLYEELSRKFLQENGLNNLTPEELEQFNHIQFNFDMTEFDDTMSLEQFRELINKKDEQTFEDKSVKKRILRR